jgi:DUF1680 family protein
MWEIMRHPCHHGHGMQTGIAIMKFLTTCISSMVMLAVAPAALANEPVAAFPLDHIRLTGGPLQELQELHRSGMVGHLEPDRLLFQFRKQAGLPQPDGIVSGYGSWDDHFIAGHYAGHYLSAASRMFASTGDRTFRDKASYMVKVLAECQQKLGGGYLSAFPESKFDNLEKNPHGASVEYYTIHKIIAGLVDVARYCQDELAYQIATRMADHFAARMAKLTSQQIEKLLRTDYTGNPVNEFGGMSEALVDLYLIARQRGDGRASRHLDFAKVFIRDWLVDPLVRGEDKLDGLHGNTHAAQVSGIAKFALVTGSAREATAAKQFWKFVIHDHSFVNGSNSFHEKLREPGIEVAGTGVATLNALTSESCNTHNMLKLTRYLGEISPDSSMADFHENALFNHLVATVAPDHGKVTYYLSMRPGDHRIHVPDPVCCQGTGIEMAGRLGEGLYSHRGKELWIHGYASSTLDWRENGLQLRQETRYPEDGVVRIHLEAKAPVQATLHLRIPGWADAPVPVLLNGQPFASGQPGSYLALANHWQPDDVLSLEFPMKLRIRHARDDRSMVSFFHGPLLLAGALGRDRMPESDVNNHMALDGAPAWPVPVRVSENPGQPDFRIHPVNGMAQTYEMVLSDPQSSQPVTVRLEPFFRVHHQRYALYWKSLTPQAFEAYAKEIAAKREHVQSFIGKPELEQAVQFQGEKSNSGTFQGRQWRDADPGGWFSYRLAIPSQQDLELVCTYWGGESNKREFDILVEGRQIASQVLANNQPGAFFDVAYPLPNELLHGRQFITIRFQAKPDFQAGGVFNLRLVPVSR